MFIIIEKPVSPVKWENNNLYIIDQTLLPLEKKLIELKDIQEVWTAINNLKVRGAPAIGIAAAFGLYLKIKDGDFRNKKEFLKELHDAGEFLATSRPTAVNLFWAIKRIQNKAADSNSDNISELKELVLQEALAIKKEDEEMCKKIGENGALLLKDYNAVLTHCNAGTLATACYGTALAPVYKLAEKGSIIRVFVDETRPLLQGARLTAWELQQSNIPVTLITDSMAAKVMGEGKVQAVIVGADRITANGDTANKIGTYSLAILAKEHGIPFYIAAPSSTFDLNLSTGADIPIEERSYNEISCCSGKRTAPQNIDIYNPAFDVTPWSYITAIITEKGVLYPPFSESINNFFGEE